MNALPATRLPCSGGVLAGGAGTRFGGQDKGWLTLHGRALIEWTLDALRAQTDELLISANRNRERYAALGVAVLHDARPEAFDGPFAGLVALLGAARHDWLLCVPCDAYPLAPDLAARFSALVQGEGADAAVLADAEGIHPTFCFVRTALAADAARAFAAGERAPRRWLARHRLAQLHAPVPPNLNTPAALAALESRL